MGTRVPNDDGFAELASLGQDASEAVAGRRRRGVEFEGAAEVRDRFLGATGVRQDPAEAGQRQRVIRLVIQRLPQLLRNVRVGNVAPLENAEVRSAIEQGETALGEAGRLLIRKSGTEPVIRVMAEGDDEALVGKVVDGIVEKIQRAAG